EWGPSTPGCTTAAERATSRSVTGTRSARSTGWPRRRGSYRPWNLRTRSSPAWVRHDVDPPPSTSSSPSRDGGTRTSGWCSVRLGEALRRDRADGPLLVPYVLVDRRRKAQLRPLVEALRDGGANALELGFPFSDPIADGPVLEAASGRAIAAGTTWRDLLDAVRVSSHILPTAVMTYAN